MCRVIIGLVTIYLFEEEEGPTKQKLSERKNVEDNFWCKTTTTQQA